MPSLKIFTGEARGDAVRRDEHPCLFRSPSKEIAEFAAGEIGEKEILKASEQYSYGADPVRDGVSTGKEKERETLVSYSDIQTLPDLSCYVTLPGPYPAVKLALKYKSRPKIAEGFILRNLDTRTDARLDTLLEAREAESSHARMLFTPDEATGMPEGEKRRRILLVHRRRLLRSKRLLRRRSNRLKVFLLRLRLHPSLYHPNATSQPSRLL
jgi:hypothetical protein